MGGILFKDVIAVREIYTELLYTLWVKFIYFVLGTYSSHCASPLVVECLSVTAEPKCVTSDVWVWMSDRSIIYLPEFRINCPGLGTVSHPTDLLPASYYRVH